MEASGHDAVRDVIHARTPRQREMVCGVAIDMSAPYAKAIREKLPHADIVYDKFHVQKHLNEAVDATRRSEHARLLKAHGRRLSKTKCLWLSGLEHLSDESLARREDLLRASLRTGKAWGLKEMFSDFWRSRDKDFAAANFDFWHAQVLKSGIRPMIRAAATLRRHLGGLLAWFDSRIDNAMSEGYNSVIQTPPGVREGLPELRELPHRHPLPLREAGHDARPGPRRGHPPDLNAIRTRLKSLKTERGFRGRYARSRAVSPATPAAAGAPRRECTTPSASANQPWVNAVAFWALAARRSRLSRTCHATRSPPSSTKNPEVPKKPRAERSLRCYNRLQSKRRMSPQ